MKKKVALLISSYDGASDLWIPLEQSYMNFWEDNPFNTYIVTNSKDCYLKSFNFLKIGKEKSWSDSILKALNKLEEDYILLTYDDLFLCEKINTDEVLTYIDYALENEISCLQLFPAISKFDKIDHNLRKKRKDALYRTGTVWSLWKKEVLINLLDIKENAWEFERNGNNRSKKYNDFLCTERPIIPFFNGVIKGKWDPIVIKKLHKLGININRSLRSELKGINLLHYRLKQYKFKLYKYFNRSLPDHHKLINK